MGSLRRDVSFGLTQARRHPGIGIVVVLTLALGIGVTTSIFSVVHAVLLEQLPYDRPGELVMITSELGGSTLVRDMSGPDLVEVETAVSALADVAWFAEATVGPMTRVDRPEHVRTVPVSWDLFALLGVSLAFGRDFNADDGVPVPQGTDPPPVAAIISHDFWTRYFGGGDDAVGAVVHIWGGATEIVGVLPEGFRLTMPPELNMPPDADIWRAMRWDPAQSARTGRWYRAVGRLAEGASLRQARREVERFAADLRVVHPEHAAEQTELRVTAIETAIARPLRATLWLLMGAVSLVLLIACANAANLLLARGAARTDEMAVRASLGAGRQRLVRQLLTESAVLALMGTICGVLLARVGVGLLHAIRPADLHRLEGVTLNAPVLGFSAGVAVLTTVLAGLLPALQAARVAPGVYLKTRAETAGRRGSRAVLVIGEVALSLVLLGGAGLLLRSFGELQRMPLGFDPDRVLTVTATQSPRTHAERQAYEDDLVRAASEVPGVRSAGIVFPLPLNGVYVRDAEYAVDGRQTDPTAWTTVYYRTVSPTYFETMGLDLRRGRGFTALDLDYDVPVVVLDERLAAREYADRNPVGETFWVRGMEGDTLRAEVVGVVEHAPQWDHRDPRPSMYFPRIFYQSHEVSVVARVEGDPAQVAPELSRAIHSVDPTFPADLVPMNDLVRERLASARFLLVLMQIFGVLALGLSAVGLYGVLSYSVRQRTRELGLRSALGAKAGRLVGAVVGHGLGLASIGVVAGMVIGLVAARALRSQLFNVAPADPITWAGAAAVTLSVAALASVLPSIRAARVDPVVALREE